MPSEPKILLFDGVCNLCNSTVQFIIKRDPAAKFKFAALQSEAGRAQLQKFGLAADYSDSFIYIRGDAFYKKSTAVLTMLKDLGGAWAWLYGFMVFPAGIRNFFYDQVAKYRYKLFGKKDSCMVPSPSLQNRFLD